MRVRSQIDELAPELNIAEWVQGEPSNIVEEKSKIYHNSISNQLSWML